ncbi:hypothetical protein Agabi119p4_178 [Agaricus bisporus var. burnettii]|uniref:Cytochrome P450 n=1 Tax=Agaricus bisporus var. burnettii TaxID=192524 RepID=A0A8H7KKH8_AGABI|nr:hypothetical protein Agabi119p4_178 [Agaricus bisporus var. burnettii]
MDDREPGEIVRGDSEESFLLVYLGLVGLFFCLFWSRRDRAKYNQIPAVGFSGTLFSFISAIKCLHNPVGMLKKAYDRLPGGIFRYPTLSRWIVVVTKPKYVEELRKVSEDELSASQALNEIIQLPYTINSRLLANTELKSLLGAQLMQNLHQTLPEIYSELGKFVSELIPSGDDEWKYIDEVEVLTRLCNRVTNLALVGSSLCRNPEYADLTITATRNLELYGRKLRLLPAILRPLFAFLFTPFPRIRRNLRRMLVSELEGRQENPDESLHNDMITWFLTHDAKAEMPIDELANHILLVNYLAVHPMSTIMIRAFRNLARYPEYAREMRLEVERIHRRDGWSKSAIDKMQRVDSFLKETMRLETDTTNASYPCLSMARVALRTITFSSGATLPPNTLLFTGSQLIHSDKRHYSEPDVFKPSRFASSSLSSDSFTSSKATSSSEPFISVPASLTLPATSSTFLAWGHGKHACPGRFFASSVMKLMLAYFVLNFDFQLPPLLDDTHAEGDKKEEGKILWIEVKRRQHRPA